MNKIMDVLQLIFRKVYFNINYKKLSPKLNYDCIDKVVFVAHPDDEFIFLGNKLMREDGWLVICMTNGDSRIRSKEFIGLMKELDLQYKILNFKDGMDEKWDYAQVKSVISEIVSSIKNCKMIVAHNSEGEYGHFQHKQLHRLVKETCPTEKIMVFCKNKNLFMSNNKLSEDDKQSKHDLAIKYYKSQIDVINKLEHYLEYEGLENI